MEANAFKKVKGYSKLTDEQKEFFLRHHKNHMRAMGTDNQRKYSLENVKKVIWDAKEKCIKVYYEDIWWHYARGAWW